MLQRLLLFSGRPKDLSTIKRHIENGTIRTTAEFQHDMMLMFTNAIMYNSSNHNVYRMAVDMYDDVLQQIEVSHIPIFLFNLLLLSFKAFDWTDQVFIKVFEYRDQTCFSVH